MFNFFKKKDPKNLEINFHDNSMVMNGTSLSFPLSLKDIEAVLGKPDQVVKKESKYIKYVYDNAGIVFEHSSSIRNHLKKCRVYIDDEHLLSTISFYYGDVVKPMFGEEELPKMPCQAVVSTDGKTPYFLYDRHRTGDFNFILWTPRGTNFNGRPDVMRYPLTISYYPEIKHERQKSNPKVVQEKYLHFDNLNFKLAIIQVLMYDLDILKPAFDIFDFSEEFSELDIDTESTELVEPALEYFKNLQISQKYASLVKEIDIDGGNEIFMNLIPQWDGEDSTFDLNEVSLVELKQFPNLKQATIMSSNFEQVKETFAKAGVDVELV